MAFEIPALNKVTIKYKNGIAKKRKLFGKIIHEILSDISVMWQFIFCWEVDKV